jgi:hypothetical protein
MGPFRTDATVARALKKMSAASGLSQNQILNAIVRNALRDPKAIAAAVTHGLVRAALDPKDRS